MAYGIFHESIDRLVDRACDPDTVAAMRETMQRTPGVVRVDDIKTRLFGSRTYVDAEIAVDGALPLRDAHVIAEAVHHELERDYPDVKHCARQPGVTRAGKGKKRAKGRPKGRPFLRARQTTECRFLRAESAGKAR